MHFGRQSLRLLDFEEAEQVGVIQDTSEKESSQYKDQKTHPF